MREDILRAFLDSERIESHTGPSVAKKYRYGASMFTRAPQTVILPNDIPQLAKVIRYAMEHTICVVGYGGGSNTGGAGAYAHVAIDIQKMNHIEPPRALTTAEARLAPHGATHLVETDAGVRMSALQEHLARHALCVPIAPSSQRRATVGGALSTNAGSPESYLYSFIARWVERISFIDGVGNEITCTERDIHATHAHSSLREDKGPRLGWRILHRRLIADNKVRAVMRRYSSVPHGSGYNFDAVMRAHTPARAMKDILCGAMGTLGIICRTRLYCKEHTHSKSVIRVTFGARSAFFHHIRSFISCMPRERGAVSAIELLPITRIREEVTILIGLTASGADSALALMRALQARFRHISLCAHIRSRPAVDAAWNMRMHILKELSATRDTPLPIVNDVTLPFARIRPFVARAFRIFRRARIPCVVYGHIGNGTLHLRPLLRRPARRPDANPHASRDTSLDTLTRIAARIYRSVLRYGGAIGSEHGTGILRAPYVQKQWGRAAYRYMKEIKTLFDPHYIFDDSALFCARSFRKQLRHHHTIPLSSTSPQ